MSNISDVAKKAGVAVSTVSRLINASGPVSAQSRKKIREAMEELNYIPNHVAKSLRSKETRMIGILIPDLNNGAYIDLIKDAEIALKEKMYIPVISSTSGEFEREAELIYRFLTHRFDGMIFYTYNIGRDTLDFYKALTDRIPCVFMDQCDGELPIDQVYTDGKLGLCMATKYFIDKGHERIGLVSGNKSVTVPRLHGYLEALDQAGLESDPELIFECSFEYADGINAGHYFANLADRPTAIVSISDVLAIATLRGMKECGLRVPKDVEIIGFDDLSYSSMLETTLSTLAQPFGAMGRTAVDKLISRINNPELPYSKTVYKPELILRESTK